MLLIDIRFYTRRDCHLCVTALAEVRRIVERAGSPAEVRVVDIDSDPEACALYDTRVPVCFVGDQHLFDYRCDAKALESALEAASGPTASSSELHVCIDARTLRPPMSGVGRYTQSMIRALEGAEGGLSITALTDSASALAVRENFSSLAMLQTRAELESHPSGDWHFHRRVPRSIRRLDPKADIFWGPAFQIPSGNTGCPKVVTIHDMTAFLHPETMPPKFAFYLRWLVRRSVRRADRIVAVSEATKRALMGALGVESERIAVITEGPLLALETGGAAAPSPLPGDLEGRPFLLFVGAVEPRKNIPFLLRVFESLRDAGDERLLVICGPPGWRNGPILRALAESPARDAVRRLEYVDDSTLRALYRAADALLMPSLDEGFGLPALEAAALGTSAFVSDRGALPEVAVAPEFVLPLEIEAWTTAITSPPPRDEAQLRKHVARFSWERAASDLQRLFREVVA